MIGQSRKGLASFHASVSFWCLSSLKIGRKNGAVSLILVSFVLNYKCSDFLCQSAFIYKISKERSVGTITETENVPPPLRGVQPRLRLDFLIPLHIILRLQHKYCLAKSLFSRARQTASRNTSTVTLCGPRQTKCLPSQALSVAPQCPFFENDQKFWYNLYIRNEERKNPEPFL